MTGADHKQRTCMSDPYHAAYFEGLSATRSSAEVVIPLIAGMVAPRSVVDVGCGIGVWLAVCLQAGIDDIVGVDGDYVPRDQLLIPHDRFASAYFSEPFSLGRRFDLAISLEVAEHLPEAAAQGFVASLTRLAPVVLFSAAIPGQGGPGHVNEQWQEYWRSKFSAAGYVACDAIRPLVWGNDCVRYYYQQNILVYVAAADFGCYPRLASVITAHSVDLVHPWLFKNHAFWEPTLGWLVRALPRMLANSARHHLGHLAGTWPSRRSGGSL